MSDYRSTTAAILKQTQQIEAALPLKNFECRSQFFFHRDLTPKVCLFLHGFTAAPYQFEPLGRACFAAGYNVLMPRLPGHGQAGDWQRQQPPPLPTQAKVYQAFVLEWLDIAQQLGDRVVIGGLSAGGTLAAWAALNYPDSIDRALLFAPFLGHRIVPMNWFIRRLPVYFEWPNKNDAGNFGYKGFSMPSLRLFLEMSDGLFDRASYSASPPILVVCSESDWTTSLQQQQRLFRAIEQRQPQSRFHCFSRRYKMRHRMLTKIEGNQHVDLVIDLARDYLLDRE